MKSRKKMNNNIKARLRTIALIILIVWITFIVALVEKKLNNRFDNQPYVALACGTPTAGVTDVLFKQINSDIIVVEKKTIAVGKANEVREEEEKAKEAKKKKKEKALKKKKAYEKKLKKVFGYVPSEDEISLFKHIAMHESGNTEPHEGIVALMACIANRVARDDRFPNTITKVGYQRGQMTCVTDGSIWNYTVNDKVEGAWEDLINGGYKRHPKIVFWTAGRYNPYSHPEYVIGHHYFGS